MGQKKQIRTDFLPQKRSLSFFSVQSAVAFTLLELMIVIAIVGIFLSLVVLKLAHFGQSSRLKAAAREVAKTVGLARSQAARYGRDCGIIFDLNNNSYSLILPSKEGFIDPASFSERELTSWRFLPRGVDFAEVLINGERRNQGRVFVRVTSTGFITPHQVRLTIPEGQAFSIEVNPLTGKVTFSE